MAQRGGILLVLDGTQYYWLDDTVSVGKASDESDTHMMAHMPPILHTALETAFLPQSPMWCSPQTPTQSTASKKTASPKMRAPPTKRTKKNKVLPIVHAPDNDTTYRPNMHAWLSEHMLDLTASCIGSSVPMQSHWTVPVIHETLLPLQSNHTTIERMVVLWALGVFANQWSLDRTFHIPCTTSDCGTHIMYEYVLDTNNTVRTAWAQYGLSPTSAAFSNIRFWMGVDFADYHAIPRHTMQVMARDNVQHWVLYEGTRRAWTCSDAALKSRRLADLQPLHDMCYPQVPVRAVQRDIIPHVATTTRAHANVINVRTITWFGQYAVASVAHDWFTRRTNMGSLDAFPPWYKKKQYKTGDPMLSWYDPRIVRDANENSNTAPIHEPYCKHHQEDPMRNSLACYMRSKPTNTARFICTSTMVPLKLWHVPTLMVRYEDAWRRSWHPTWDIHTVSLEPLCAAQYTALMAHDAEWIISLGSPNTHRTIANNGHYNVAVSPPTEPCMCPILDRLVHGRLDPALWLNRYVYCCNPKAQYGSLHAEDGAVADHDRQYCATDPTSWQSISMGMKNLGRPERKRLGRPRKIQPAALPSETPTKSTSTGTPHVHARNASAPLARTTNTAVSGKVKISYAPPTRANDTATVVSTTSKANAMTSRVLQAAHDGQKHMLHPSYNPIVSGGMHAMIPNHHHANDDDDDEDEDEYDDDEDEDEDDDDDEAMDDENDALHMNERVRGDITRRIQNARDIDMEDDNIDASDRDDDDDNDMVDQDRDDDQDDEEDNIDDDDDNDDDDDDEDASS